MEVLTNFIVGIILQWIHVSNHHKLTYTLNLHPLMLIISQKSRKKRVLLAPAPKPVGSWGVLPTMTPHFFRSLFLDWPSPSLPVHAALLWPSSNLRSLPLISPPAVSAPGGGGIIVHLSHSDAPSA